MVSRFDSILSWVLLFTSGWFILLVALAAYLEKSYRTGILVLGIINLILSSMVSFRAYLSRHRQKTILPE